MEATRKRGLHVPRGLPFVLPYLPFLIVFGIAPTLYALDLAFTNVKGRWVGFDNFTRTFHDFRFLPAFRHVLVYTCVWLAALMVFVVGLALLLHGRASRASSTFRFLYYLPGALAGSGGGSRVAVHARSDREPGLVPVAPRARGQTSSRSQSPPGTCRTSSP